MAADKTENMSKILVIVVPRHGVKFIVDFVFNLFNAVQSLSGAFVFSKVVVIVLVAPAVIPPRMAAPALLAVLTTNFETCFWNSSPRPPPINLSASATPIPGMFINRVAISSSERRTGPCPTKFASVKASFWAKVSKMYSSEPTDKLTRIPKTA